MRRSERASTMLTSNRPVEDWGKLLGDAAVVSAMLDRLLHHGHVLKCGPRSLRTKRDATATIVSDETSVYVLASSRFMRSCVPCREQRQLSTCTAC